MAPGSTSTGGPSTRWTHRRCTCLQGDAGQLVLPPLKRLLLLAQVAVGVAPRGADGAVQQRMALPVAVQAPRLPVAEELRQLHPRQQHRLEASAMRVQPWQRPSRVGWAARGASQEPLVRPLPLRLPLHRQHVVRAVAAIRPTKREAGEGPLQGAVEGGVDAADAAVALVGTAAATTTRR